MEKTIVVCDNCKKEGLIDAQGHVGFKWYKLTTLDLQFAKDKKRVKKKNTLYIDESDDPDFCSKECLLKWFEKEVNKITKR